MGTGDSKQGGQAAGRRDPLCARGSREGLRLWGHELGPLGLLMGGRNPRQVERPLLPHQAWPCRCSASLGLSQTRSSDTSLRVSPCQPWAFAGWPAHSELRATQTGLPHPQGAGPWDGRLALGRRPQGLLWGGRLEPACLPYSSPGQPRPHNVDTADRQMEGWMVRHGELGCGRVGGRQPEWECPEVRRKG